MELALLGVRLEWLLMLAVAILVPSQTFGDFSLSSPILQETSASATFDIQPKTFARFWSALIERTTTEDIRKYALVFLGQDPAANASFSAQAIMGTLEIPLEWQEIVKQNNHPVTFLQLPAIGDWDALKCLRILNRAIFVIWNLDTPMTTWKNFAARLKQLRNFPSSNYLVISTKSKDLANLAKDEFSGQTGVFIFDPAKNGQPVISMGFQWMGLLGALAAQDKNGEESLLQMQTNPKLLNGATLKSSSANYCPFVCRHADGEVHGMEAQMFRSIGKTYNFTTVITEPEDGAWGALVNGHLTGMLGDVFYGKAEVAFAEFYVGVEQFNFLEPIVYMQDCNLVAVPLPKEVDINWHVLTVPLSWPVWILSAVVTLTFTILYAAVGFDEFSFGKALFQNYCDIIGQNMDQTKFKADFNTRLCLLNWWIFTFIITTLYRAGLTAVLTVPAFAKPIDSIPELESSGLDFGMILYGDTYYDTWFRTHSMESFRRLGERVTYLQSAVDGFKKVAAGDFSFSEPQWSSKFTIAMTFPGSQEKLPFHLMKGCVMQAYAGWFVPRHAFYTPHIKAGWRRAGFAGVIQKGIEDVIREEAQKAHQQANYQPEADKLAGGSQQQSDSSAAGVLNVKDLATAFIITMIGYAFACLWLLGEIIWMFLKRRRDDRQLKKYNKRLQGIMQPPRIIHNQHNLQFLH